MNYFYSRDTRISNLSLANSPNNINLYGDPFLKKHGPRSEETTWMQMEVQPSMAYQQWLDYQSSITNALLSLLMMIWILHLILWNQQTKLNTSCLLKHLEMRTPRIVVESEIVILSQSYLHFNLMEIMQYCSEIQLGLLVIVVHGDPKMGFGTITPYLKCLMA